MKIQRSSHVNPDSRQCLDRELDSGKTEQRGFTVNGVHQNIKITFLRILTAHNRSKNAGIERVIALDNAANLSTMPL